MSPHLANRDLYQAKEQNLQMKLIPCQNYSVMVMVKNVQKEGKLGPSVSLVLASRTAHH